MGPGGIGGLDVVWRARWFGGAAAVLLVLGCKPVFTGPYACEPGYASCARMAPTATMSVKSSLVAGSKP